MSTSGPAPWTAAFGDPKSIGRGKKKRMETGGMQTVMPARGHLFASGKRVLRQWHKPYRPPDSHLMLAAVTQGGPTSTSRLPHHVCAPRTPFLIRGAARLLVKTLQTALLPRTRDPSVPSGQGSPASRADQELLSKFPPRRWKRPASNWAPTPAHQCQQPDQQARDHTPEFKQPVTPKITETARPPQMEAPARGPTEARHPGSRAPAPLEPDQRHGQDPIPLPAHRGRAEHAHPDAKRLHRGRGPSVPACGRPSPAPRPGSPCAPNAPLPHPRAVRARSPAASVPPLPRFLQPRERGHP